MTEKMNVCTVLLHLQYMNEVQVKEADGVGYLWHRTLNQDLAHVDHRTQGLDVVPLPQPDGLSENLQLQLLSFPDLLALSLV